MAFQPLLIMESPLPTDPPPSDLPVPTEAANGAEDDIVDDNESDFSDGDDSCSLSASKFPHNLSQKSHSGI
jgi:hypothetical protein